MIPPWTSDGLLPPGIHRADWPEVLTSLGWNARRQSLLLGLLDALKALSIAGCGELWLDGSFVTDKEIPGDYDACWDPTNMDRLMLDPILIDYSPSGRAAIKSKYLGDIIIAGTETTSGLPFVNFFQQTRDGRPKGIVSLNPQEIP
jgi:hypothetical protein